MINMSIEFAHKMSLAYSATCKTLCRELKLPQTAFDILMVSRQITRIIKRRVILWKYGK